MMAGRRLPVALAGRLAVYAAGVGVPIVIGLIAVPVVARYVSTAQLGILSLAWALLSFIGNLDLGVGRSLARHVALNDHRGDPGYVGVGLAIQAAIGLMAALLIVGGLHGGIAGIALRPVDLVVILLAMPAALMTAGARYVMEGEQRFAASSAIGMLANALVFVVPAAMLASGWRFDDALTGLFVSRIAVLAAAVPVLGRSRWARSDMATARGHARDIFDFGGWVTVSQVAALVSQYADKLAGARFLPMAQMAAFTVPFDFLMRFGIIPAVLVRVVSPQLDRVEYATPAGRRLLIGLNAFGLAYALGVLAMMPFLPWALHLWLGGKLGPDSGTIAQIVMLQVAMNGVAYVAAAIHVSNGAPRTPAVIQVASLVVNAVGIPLAIIAGRVDLLAAQGTARMIVETLALTVLAAPLLPGRLRAIGPLAVIAITAGGVAIIVAMR